MGGELYWPADEAWPSCDGHGLPSPMIPVLQLWVRDVPDVPMRPGTDVFQLLWCPNHHDILSDEDYGPRIRAFWRDSGNVARSLDNRPPARTEVVESHFVPRPCVLHPERVWEFPDYNWHLTADERAEMDRHDRPGELSYEDYSGAAPGTKVGGLTHWRPGEMEWPSCPDGHPMEHLLTVATTEYDGHDWPAWLPAEDRDSSGGPVGDWQDLASQILLGDGGDMFVFICFQCADWPTTKRLQS